MNKEKKQYLIDQIYAFLAVVEEEFKKDKKTNNNENKLSRIYKKIEELERTIRQDALNLEEWAKSAGDDASIAAKTYNEMIPIINAQLKIIEEIKKIFKEE
jgi:hypothetical protein